MEVNMMGVLAATVAQFAFGALWYMPLFGSVWGKMHGFDKLSKKEQDQARSKMGPWYGAQLLVTAITAFVLAKLIIMLPAESPYMLAAWVWFAFVFPTQVSGVIFGGTDEKWIPTKIAIQAFGALGCVLVAAFVLSLF